MKPMLVLLVAALGLPSLAGAETVFKWVDANGVTNYTTAPPPAAAAGRVAEVNASPVTNLVATSLPVDEALYWRERRQREMANDISNERSRRDNDLLRQQLARQAAADDEQAAKAEEAHLQAAYNQCMLARRLDCAYGNEYNGDGYGVPVAVVTGPRPGPGTGHDHPPGAHPHPPHTTPPATPPVLVRRLAVPH